MELVTISHPKHGILYELFENLEEVRNESKIDRRKRHTVQTSTGGIQLSVFPV